MISSSLWTRCGAISPMSPQTSLWGTSSDFSCRPLIQRFHLFFKRSSSTFLFLTSVSVLFSFAVSLLISAFSLLQSFISAALNSTALEISTIVTLFFHIWSFKTSIFTVLSVKTFCESTDSMQQGHVEDLFLVSFFISLPFVGLIWEESHHFSEFPLPFSMLIEADSSPAGRITIFGGFEFWRIFWRLLHL